MAKILLFFIFLLFRSNFVFGDGSENSDQEKLLGDYSGYEQQLQLLESKAETKAANLHRVDTLNIMLYTFLLILTVCTVWLFKHRRLRFVHETGLTLIYGLLVGLIIWLTSADSQKKYLEVVPVNESEAPELAPNFIRLELPSAATGINRTASFFRYKFDGEERIQDNQQYDNLMEMKATFDPEIFFDILLPPIMFNAGFSLKRKHFFRNIGSILLFAVGGTTISCVVVGLVTYGFAILAGLGSFTLAESMLFGALISATDPVTVLAIFSDLKVENDLFAIVFGESALNDAVAIVLFRTIEDYSPSATGASTIDALGILISIGNFLASFLGSISLGVICGFVAALFMKFTRIRDYPLLETSLFVLFSYMSFLTAEASGMTGVVSALFCGICQAHYTYNNLSDESKTWTKQFFELLNFLSENFIFTYIGVSLFTSKAHLFNWWFIGGAFVAVIVGRAAHVYPFSFALNLARKPKIPCNHMHMMMFAGLRGAVAFALAIRNTATKERCLIYTATSLIVIFTVIVNGGLTIPLIEWLKIKHGDDREAQVPIDNSTRPTLTSSMSDIPNHNPGDKSVVFRQWYNFDRKFMKPLLTNSRPSLMETAPGCCQPMARLLTTTEQMSMALRSHSMTQSEGDLIEETYHDGITASPPVNGIMNPALDPKAISNPSSSSSLTKLVRENSSGGVV